MYGTSASIKDSYVNWLSGNSASYKRFTGLYVLQPKAGRTYTLSLLARVNEVSGSVTLRPSHISGSQIPGAGGLRIPAPTDSFELLTYTFTPTSISGPVDVEILVANGTGDYVDIDMVAWKLEPGGHQTLAYQGDDGNWYMTAPPDYDLQYALCSLYSPSTGEWVGNQHSNPNLLDNWYFADPINQRGQTEYESGIGIDRWHGKGVQLKNGYLHVEGPMYQMIEADVAKFYYGKRITLSILLADGSLYSGSNVVPSEVTSSNQWRHCCSVINGQSLGFYVMANTGHMQIFRINSDAATAGLDVVAVKTELGPVQTLAHQDADGNWVLNDPPSNKALELAKCQRYFERVYLCDQLMFHCFRTNALKCNVYFKVRKRTMPTASADSMKLFRASDNLPVFGDVAQTPDVPFISVDGLTISFLQTQTNAVDEGRIAYLGNYGHAPYVDVSADL